MKIRVESWLDLLVIGGTVDGVEAAIRGKKNGKKVLLATPYSYFGEDLCAVLDLRNVPELLKQNGFSGFLTPMTVKKFLDDRMIRNDVPFLFQTFTLGLAGDCVILANQDGIFAVQAKTVLDTTPYGTAARQSSMPFPVFPAGESKALWRVLVPAGNESADCVCEGRSYRLSERETSVTLNALDAESLFHAEQEARKKLWSPDLVFAADRIVFSGIPGPSGPDPDRIVFTPEQYQGICEDRQIIRKEYVEYEPSETVSFDIAVIGGGTAGGSAGLPGAKKGLRTLVLERLSRLGGVSTQGRIASAWHGLHIGHTKELEAKVKACTNEELPPRRWNTENKEHILETENYDAGVSVWFDSVCCSVFMKGEKIDRIWAGTPFGGISIAAQQFIDCTGNALLAFQCGASTEFADTEEPAYQGSGMCPAVPGHSYFNTDYMFSVDSSNRDVTRAFLMGRARCRDLFDLSQLPGTRERRRIIGEIVLRAADFYAHRKYPDTIALACSNFDTHGFTVEPLFLFHPTDELPYVAEIPFRALLSPGISNLMTTGLGISAQRDAMPLIRMIADVQNQGYTAGLLAAEAVCEKKELREIDLPKIQKLLKEQGFLNCPEQGLQSALSQDAMIFSDPDLPALEREYNESPDFEKAIRLAFLHSSIGLDLLKKTIQANPWDEGWHYRGMDQFGKAVSRMDAAILAMIPLTEDCAFLLPRLHDLTMASEFSHFRAVTRFLMKHPASAAVPDLERLLKEYPCHAVPDWQHLIDSPFTGLCDTEERNFQLKELYLAGALHACDPGNGLARDFLEQYRNGVHALYAVYAEKWLHDHNNSTRR